VGLADGQLAPGTVNGWNLLGGGDGVRRQTMEEAYRATHPPSSLRAATFTWGNPYDTKVSLATVAGAPPDAAVVHLTRASNLAEAVLLTENTADMLHLVGLTAGHFSPRTWRQQLDGRSYAVPLDHHPVLPTYNTELRRLRSVPSSRHKSPYRSSRSA
jgi:multiple sugar transport system substrate-binding protein